MLALLCLLLCLCTAACAEEVLEVEAENGELLGGAKKKMDIQGCFVENLTADGDGVAVTFTVATPGFYDIVIRAASGGNEYKENFVLLDGEHVGDMVTERALFDDVTVPYIYFDAGEHVVSILKNWGWIKIDKLSLKTAAALNASIYEVAPTLVNPNADENALRLMHFLCDVYGDKILSGQYCDSGPDGVEMRVIEQATGKTPAVLGLDMIELSPSRVTHGGSKVIDYAKDFWDRGGIVTFCWHWNVPEKYIKGIWWKGFYTEQVTIDLAAIMNGEDPEGYDLLVSDIDAIAGHLLELQEAGVPVLWRPLHEASGGWFWWGASGADAYKQLYVLMYDRLTNYHGLNNLIWVWNGQDAAWYPGDEYVDIIGEDIYPGNRVYSTQSGKFLGAVDYTDARKVIVLSENGCLIDPELAVRDGVMWGLFCTWQGEFVQRNGRLSEEYNDQNMLRKVYTSDAVLTLDELPDLKNYPLPDAK